MNEEEIIDEILMKLYGLIYKIRQLNPTASIRFLKQFNYKQLEKYYNRLLSVKPFVEN